MSVGAVNKQTGDRIPTAGMPAIDDALDLTSVNPVQNAIVTAALADKQDKSDNALQTTDKTIVGGINEHEGDIDSLKSGLMNVGTGDLLLSIAKNDTEWKHIEGYSFSDYRYLFFATSYYGNTPNPVATSAMLPMVVLSVINEYYQMDSNIKINFNYDFSNIRVQDWGDAVSNYLLVYGIK